MAFVGEAMKDMLIQKAYGNLKKRKFLGEEVDEMEISKYAMPAIAIFMNGDVREQVHRELAPCNNNEFIKRYCEIDPDFENVLKSEFGIDIMDL